VDRRQNVKRTDEILYIHKLVSPAIAEARNPTKEHLSGMESGISAPAPLRWFMYWCLPRALYHVFKKTLEMLSRNRKVPPCLDF